MARSGHRLQAGYEVVRTYISTDQRNDILRIGVFDRTPEVSDVAKELLAAFRERLEEGVARVAPGSRPR
jgi:hypothetical protein